MATWHAIEDADGALDAALARWPTEREFGARLLLIYGALQALYVQQDCVAALLNHVHGQKKKAHVYLSDHGRERRKLRDGVIGHPEDRGGHVIQGTLASDTPELQVLYPNRGRRDDYTLERTLLDLPVTVHAHRTELAELLTTAVAQLVQEDRAHMSKFGSKPLGPLADQLRSAIADANRELWRTADSADPMFGWHVEDLAKKLDQFERALQERGELEARSDTLGPQLRFARHCLARLTLFASRGASGEYHADAQAFIHALEHLREGLAEAAAEIDAEYSKAGDAADSHPTP